MSGVETLMIVILSRPTWVMLLWLASSLSALMNALGMVGGEFDWHAFP
jgi:hypothetical protein